jgi:pimeloyl-ACP methyl ester carboxylesterase
MIGRILFSLLCFVLLLCAVSWHLKILLLYFIFLLLKKFIPQYAKHQKIINRGAFALLLITLWFSFPNRTSGEDDYLQSVYFNHNTKETVSMPWVPYFTNMLGEGDVMMAIALVSKIIPVDDLTKSRVAREMFSYSRDKSITQNNFIVPYRQLEWKGNPPHNVPFQLLKGIGWYRNIDHYFLHIPEGKKPEDCEIIVFCHGYSGNWLLYSELFAENTDAIIIAVETSDFNGHFDKRTMDGIINTILPHTMKRIGITNRKAHLVGLSNGGSAINTALRNYPALFKTYTIISASLYTSPKIKSKTHIIYGSNDLSGGVDSRIPENTFKKYVIKGENHTLLVSKPEVVFKLINQIIHQ